MFIESLKILKTKYGKENFQAIILGSDQGRKVYLKKLISMVEKYNLDGPLKDCWLTTGVSQPVSLGSSI